MIHFANIGFGAVFAHIVDTSSPVRLKYDRENLTNKVVMRFASPCIAKLLTLCTVFNFAIGAASAYLAPGGFGVEFTARAIALFVLAAVATIQSAGSNKCGVY
jgi:hypothetical protein